MDNPRTRRPIRFTLLARIVAVALVSLYGLVAPSAQPLDRLPYYYIDEDILLWIWENESQEEAAKVRWIEWMHKHPNYPNLLKRTPQDGALIPYPFSLKACTGARWAVITPGARFLYIANGDICAYALDFKSGTATPLPGMPFHAGTFTRAVVRDRSGNFLFAVNQDSNNLSAFVINTSTGALTQAPGSPVATGNNPLSAVVDGSGRYIYVANNSSNTLSGFAIDLGTGALTPIAGSPFAAPQQPWAIAADPTGKYIFLGAGSPGPDGSLQPYRIDGTTGALTPIGAPVATFAGIGKGVAVDPTGRFVYATSGGGTESGVQAYAIGPSGALTAAGPRAATGDNPLAVMTDPTGSFVYTANQQGPNISGFQIDPVSGALSPIAGSPFPASGSPTGLTFMGVLPESVQWAVGEYFSAPLGTAGGRPPYIWSVASGALPTGLALDVVTGMITGTPTAAGIFAFTAQVADGAGAVATQEYSIDIVAKGAAAPVTVVEYYHQAFDHYFITWIADEIAKLDAGIVIKGWARTGKTFLALATAQAGTSPICRYYIPPALGDSHFFGRGTAECVATGQKFPSFMLEEPAFMHMALPVEGVCPAQTTPVYRVFSGRPDANHRYTTDRAVRAEMVGKGWIAEGDGPDFVVMCAPASGA